MAGKYKKIKWKKLKGFDVYLASIGGIDLKIANHSGKESAYYELFCDKLDCKYTLLSKSLTVSFEMAEKIINAAIMQKVDFYLTALREIIS